MIVVYSGVRAITKQRDQYRSHRVDQGTRFVTSILTISLNILQTMWQSFSFIVLSRKFRPFLVISVLYFIIVLHIYMQYLLPWENTPSAVRQIQVVHFILMIPVIGLGIDVARKSVRQELSSLSLRDWKRWFLLGSEVWLILLTIQALDTVLPEVLAGPVEDVLTSANAWVTGETSATSSWWTDLLLDSIAPYVLPAILAVYIGRNRLSDLLPLEKYWTILPSKDYFVVSVAFGIVYFHLPTPLANLGLEFFQLIEPWLIASNVDWLIRPLFLSLWLSMSYVIPILISFYIIGETINVVTVLNKSRKQMVDATVQMCLSAYSSSPIKQYQGETDNPLIEETKGKEIQSK